MYKEAYLSAPHAPVEVRVRYDWGKSLSMTWSKSTKMTHMTWGKSRMSLQQKLLF